MAADKIESGFGSVNFRPSEVFVATWDRVGYYEERMEKVCLKFERNEV